MKRLIVFVVLFFAVIFGFKNLVVYLFKPADRLTQEVSYFLKNATQYNISIGASKVVWKPYPVLEISTVKLSHPNNKEKGVFLEAEKVVCEFGLFDFVFGNSSLESIYFFNPKLYLKKNLERENWNLSFLEQVVSSSKSNLFNNVFVVNGIVFFEDIAHKKKENFSKISAQLSLKNSGKVFRFSGKFDYKEKHWNLNLLTQKFVGRYDVKLKLKEQESNFQVEAQGKLKKDDLSINGYFKVSEPNKIFPFIGVPILAKQLNVPMLGNFSYVSDKDKRGLADFTVRTDSEDAITFTGSLWDKKDFIDLVFFINRVDENLLKEQVNNFESYLNSFSKKINFEFLITRLITENFSSKDNRIKGVWFDKTLKLEQLQFLSDNLKLFGSGEGKNIFQNDYQWFFNTKLEASKLQPLLKKIFKNFDAVPDTLFQDIAADAKVKISSEGISLEVLEGKIGNTFFTGTLKHFSGKENILDLSVSNINVDEYLKLFFSEGFQEEFKKLSFNNKVFNFIGNSFWKHIPNTKFNIKGEYLLFKDEKIDNFLVKGDIFDGNLTIEEANILALKKADILFKGKIENIGNEKAALKNVILNVKSEDFPYLLNLLYLNTDLVEEKKTILDMTINGDRYLQNMKFNLVNGNFKFGLNGIVSYKPDIFFDKCRISLVYPNFHAFIKNMGFNKNILSQLDGWLNTTFEFSGNKKDILINNIKATIGVQELQGSFTFKEETDTLNGKFTTDFLDLQRVMPSFSGKENVNLTYLPKNMALDINAKKTRLKNLLFSKGEFSVKKDENLLNIKSFLEDKKLLMEISLNDLKEQYVQAYLDFKEFPLSSKVFSKESYFFGNGLMTGTVKFKCKGTFEKACFDTLDGEGKINIKRSLFGGIDIKKVQALLQQVSAEYINKERFVFGVDTSLGQGIEELSNLDFNLIFSPEKIQINDIIFNNEFFSGKGKALYSKKDKNASFFFNFKEYQDFKPLELSISFKDKLILKFDALGFYQSIMDNVKKVNLGGYKNDRSKKLLRDWKQRQLEYQGVWQDVLKWSELEQNNYLLEEVKNLEEAWNAYGKEINSEENLNEDEILGKEIVQQELIKKLESIYQQMLSNFDEESISGTISFKESILVE